MTRQSQSQLDQIAARLEPPFSSEVAAIIELLDDLAPYDEREPDSDFEPSLGGFCPTAEDVDLEEDDSDRELSLGWTAYGEMGSSGWANRTFESCGRIYTRPVQWDECEPEY